MQKHLRNSIQVEPIYSKKANRKMKLGPLENGETIFSNIDSLSPDFVPKLLPYRENEQKEIANALKPLLEGIAARNLFIYGKAGIGKTHAVKRVLEDINEFGLPSIFVNCWIHPGSDAIIEAMARQLGIVAEPSVEKIKNRIEERAVVFVFDEIDQAKDLNFLYATLEEINRKGIILISNKPEFIATLDERIRSRLQPQTIEFRDYKPEEIKGILKERRKYAFYEETWAEEAIKLLEEKTIEKGDIRFGLILMRNAGLNAEQDASRIVLKKHVEQALERLK